MKLVRCNECEEEYYIFEDLDKLGFPLGTSQCPACGKEDYTVLEDNVEVKVYPEDDEDTYDDIRHRLTVFKTELLELIRDYIDPWIE